MTIPKSAIGVAVMPMPKPNKGETRQKFVSRCVSNLTSKGEGKDAAQRVAICNSQYGRAKAEETMAAFMTVAQCGMDHSKMKEGEKCSSCDYVA